MSWWVYLERAGETVDVPPHTEGGTFAMGGIDRAELNVTYNYRDLFDFDKLHGKKALDTVDVLRSAVARLGTERHTDYWKPTSGNAGYAASILLRWAEVYPDAVWRVS